MGNKLNKYPIRITTAFLDTVSDVLPGSQFSETSGNYPTSDLSYPGMLGQYHELTKAWANRHLKNFTVASDVVVQYIKWHGTLATAPAKGILCFWSDKNAKVVTTLDTGGLEVAGVALFTGSGSQVGRYGFIWKAGVVPVKFISSTTKATPDVGDTVVSVSGNTSLADVLADATAQTYGTDRLDRKVGRLATAISSQIGTVTLDLLPDAA